MINEAIDLSAVGKKTLKPFVIWASRLVVDPWIAARRQDGQISVGRQVQQGAEPEGVELEFERFFELTLAKVGFAYGRDSFVRQALDPGPVVENLRG